MSKSVFEKLHSDGLIGDHTLENIRKNNSSALFSIHWELKALLYIGVMVLSTGIGILVYKNINTISHQVILGTIAVLTVACFIWCYKNKLPFSPEKVESSGSFADYILLLGTLSFLSLVGYLQFQYEVFGDSYGLATFIPMVFLFITAYYFDHPGILCMAITNLALWMGISVTPRSLLENGDFSTEIVIYTYLNLGLFLLLLAIASRRYHFKKHFSFIYHQFAVHLTFVALISGYSHYGYYPAFIWLIAVALAMWFFLTDALKHKSFYFVLLTVIYSYIALSAFVVRSLDFLPRYALTYLYILYFIVSGLGLIFTLIYLNRKIKA